MPLVAKIAKFYMVSFRDFFQKKKIIHMWACECQSQEF